MKIAIYSRKSKFTGKGESIENQIEMCYDYIHRNMPDVNDDDIFVYEDEGFSAKNLERPMFQQMMKDLNKTHFDFIIVYRLDRISRNVSDFSGLVEDLNKKNISFICIKEQFDTSTPMGRAMMYIASVFAQLERETIAERVKDNMHMLARTGRWLGGRLPLGYNSEKVVFDDNDKKRSYCTLVINKNEVDLVKLIFDKFLEVRSLTATVRYLISHDIKNRSGEDYNATAVKKILTRLEYCVADQKSYDYLCNQGYILCCEETELDGVSGYMTYNKHKNVDGKGAKQVRNNIIDWIVTVGKHPAIIESDKWIKANKIILTFKPCTLNTRVKNPVSLFSTLIFCGQCGHKMRPKVVTYYNGTDKENTFDYVCEYKLKSGKTKCNCKNIHGNEFDNYVITELFKFDVNGSLVNGLINNYETKITNSTNDNQTKITGLKNKITEKNDMIKNLVLSMAKSSSDTVVKYAQEEIDRLSIEITELNKEVETLSNSTELNIKINKEFDNIQEALISLRQDFDHLSIFEKRDILKNIIGKIVWNDDGQIDIFLKGTE